MLRYDEETLGPNDEDDEDEFIRLHMQNIQ